MCSRLRSQGAWLATASSREKARAGGGLKRAAPRWPPARSEPAVPSRSVVTFSRRHAAREAANYSTVAALPTSRSSGILQPDLERLAAVCQRLEAEDAATSGREAVQIDTATEVHALRLLLEAADLTLPELEKLVLRQRGEPLSRLLLNAARSGWSKMSILPALGSEFDLSRRQVAEALLKFPDLLATYTSDAAGIARRLRWHLCTDWRSKQELDSEASLGATIVREPRLVLLEKRNLLLKIHDLMRLLLTPELPPPEDPIAGSGPIDWERDYCGLLQPALRDHPRVLVGSGLKNMRLCVRTAAQRLELGRAATPEAARLLVIAGGMEANRIESRLKALGRATGAASPAALRDYLLGAPELLLVDAKTVEAARQALAARCADETAVAVAMQQLLREHGSRCLDYVEATQL